MADHDGKKSDWVGSSRSFAVAWGVPIAAAVEAG